MIETLTQLTNLFVFSYSPSYRSLVSWSDNAAAVLGVGDTSIARDGNLFLRHVHPDDRFIIMSELEQALSGKRSYRATYRWIKPETDELCWLHCRASLVQRDDGNLFEGVILDLSKEFTGAVSKLVGPDSLGTVLEALSSMVIVLDADLRLLRINRSDQWDSFTFGDEQFNHDNFRPGKQLIDCFGSSDQRALFEGLLEQIVEGNAPYKRTRIFHEDAVFNVEIAPLTEHGTVTGVLITVSEITDLVRVERELADLQKTEGLHLIAAGVAHNFNNSLQAILGQAAVINNHPEKTEMVRESSDSIIEIVQRTSELAKQLYTLDDAPPSLLLPIDLNLAVMAAINRIDDMFVSGIRVKVAFGTPSRVMAKHSDLVSAIEAVLRNAKEAMTEGGHISIKTYDTQLDDLSVQDLPAGTYGKLSITDSGPGMSSETLERCLEPFYSTKNRDQRSGLSCDGSGLGLPAALSTIRRFGGTLLVRTERDVGTTVSVYLPIEAKVQTAKPPLAVRSVGAPEIMVIDDDRTILETMKALLEDLGHSCIVTDNCQDALNDLRKYKSSLRLVLLDAVMPGLSGVAVLKKIKAMRLDLPVVGFSGAPKEVTDPMLEAGAAGLLRKPVGLRELRSLLEKFTTARVAA